MNDRNSSSWSKKTSLKALTGHLAHQPFGKGSASAIQCTPFIKPKLGLRSWNNLIKSSSWPCTSNQWRNCGFGNFAGTATTLSKVATWSGNKIWKENLDLVDVALSDNSEFLVVAVILVVA